jgi:hypothetical protein
MKILIKKILLEQNESVDNKVKELMFNSDEWDGFIEALKVKYGNIISLYHATTIENSNIIDQEGFRLTLGKNYKSWTQEPLIYFQIGKSNYVDSSRSVLYRLDVPVEFIGQYGYIDMDNVNVSDEELMSSGVEFEGMSSDMKEAVEYFIWNDLSLDGMEIMIQDRDGEGNIFKGLIPVKISG